MLLSTEQVRQRPLQCGAVVPRLNTGRSARDAVVYMLRVAGFEGKHRQRGLPAPAMRIPCQANSIMPTLGCEKPIA